MLWESMRNIPLAVSPYLDAVDDVLPEDVAAWSHGGERRQIGAGYPDGEGSVLLPHRLSSVLRLPEVATDVTPHGKLHEAEHERGESYEKQERQTTRRMEDVLHRRPRHDEKRAPPEVIREVLHSGYPAAQTGCGVLHDICEHHRHDEHGEHAVENGGERREECHVGGLVYQWEAHRHKQCRDEIGEEREGGHLFKVASYLLRHHGSSRGARRDDAGEHGFGEHQRKPGEMQPHNECHDKRDGEHLEHAHPQMPPHGAQLAVVHLAERDEEHAEHEYGQHGIEEWRHSRPCRIECGYECEHKVGGNACEDAHGQSPVLDKLQNSVFLFHFSSFNL